MQWLTKSLLIGLILLVTSCKVGPVTVQPYIIDNDTAELVDRKDQRISCYHIDATDFICVSQKDWVKIRKALDRCRSN